jgi:hypothetical protein
LFPRPILNSIGFKVIEERCLTTAYAQMGHNLEFWSQSWQPQYPWLNSLIRKGYYNWFTRLVSGVPFAVLDRLCLTTNLTIFAQKVDTPIQS